MDSKEICLRILRAESESAVSEIIDSVPELSDARNWHPIDGRETNFNVVTNQASTGSKALTELCTNMVDAVLMRHAHEKGVPFRGENAPKSVIEGVRDLVRLRGARNGILAQVDSPEYLREFAEKNLVIGVTGTGPRREHSLCFTFVDTGEGQHPKDFEDTFLSLSKGNKSDIPFVQGKYNMGSSGVLSYCGMRWYKLIVSRRYDASGDWGWTLVRRRPGDGMPIAEYFKLDGGIPSFSADALYPMQLKTGEQDDKVNISTGTVVKLYDYQMESQISFRNFRESLNENLVSTILPFRLMDYRYSPTRGRGKRRELGVDERSVNGMEFMLLRKDGDDEEPSGQDQSYDPGTKHDIGSVDDPDLGYISVQAIVLEPGIDNLPGWLRPRHNTSRVFHTVNGQVQFKENRAYISGRCKLPSLKDRIVVIVDSSDLLESAHNDVWKGDRENIRATGIGQLYRNKVTEVITNSEFLKELRDRIQQEETEKLTQEGQKALFQSLVDSDPSIAQLLPDGPVVKLRRRVPIPDDFQGKYSPTFLNLIGRAVRRDGAEIAVKGSRKVFFETDVANDYLSRPDNRGRVYAIGNEGRLSFTRSLYNGKLTINFTSLEGKVVPGDEIALTIMLLHESIPEPVTEQLRLRVVAERKPARPGPPKPPPDPDDGDEVEDSRGLPPTGWLTIDGRLIGDDDTDPWPEGFNDQDGGYISDHGDAGNVYYINYDNAHFRRVLDAEISDNDKRVVEEQYRAGMLVLMMGFEDAYSQVEEGDVKEALEENIDYIRRLAAHGAATVVMSIAKTLPRIINSASVEDPDD